MNRRNFIRSAGLTTAAAISGTAAASEDKQIERVCSTELHPHLQKAASAPRKRQVIVILEESVRYDMLNCNRQTGLRTPHMDRLAASGMRFTKAYNCQPVCSPARSAVWTGASPHTNGMWGNSMQLGRNVHTIGQRLTDQGMHCAFMGKWHLSGTDYFDSGICPPGWDPQYWYDMRTFLLELSPEDRVKSRKPETSDDPMWPAEKCYAYRVASRAVDFLKRHGNEEFLLCVAFDEPHGPSVAPRQYSQSYKDFKFPSNPNQADPMTDKPVSQDLWAGNALRHGIHPIHQPHYFGSHTFCDDQIGRVLDQIQQSAPDALVILTADHGVMLSSHHLNGKGPAMYEEITHIPFIVRLPGTVQPGSVCDNLVSHADIAASIMDYCGFPAQETIEGRSFLPMLTNPRKPTRDHAFIEFNRFEIGIDAMGGYQPIRCVTDGRYKLAVNLLCTDELYDLQSDPDEMKNLIDSAEHASIRNELHDRVLAWMDDTRDPFRGYYWTTRPWRPDIKADFHCSGMMRITPYDGYLPRDLVYETGLDATKNVYWKPM